ncbi:MAG: hypothetical protein CMJ42_18125 [Phyllobacteriaceae bacterium]|nr:hypothetical protein [Phyllobacteriaceae bacterium]MBA91063.1 hypothetical protein [Phyllobacteriaceae bacterium]
MDHLLSNGLVALVAAAVLVIETIALLVLHTGPARRLVVWNAVAGLGLLGALYMALTDGPGLAVLLALAIGLAGHVGDLVTRLREHR